MIASVVGFFLDKALLAANFFREFVKAHPFVIKFGLVMASVSAILAIVVGTLMTAIAAIGGFLLIVIPAITMAVPALIGAFSTLATIIAPVSLVLAKIAGMATVIYTAYENNFGGVRTFVQQVADAFTGLYEVIVNWSNGTTEMSEETYASLQDAGVAEFIIGLGGYIAAMIDVVKQVGQQIRDNLGYIWSPIKKTVKEVFEAIGKTFEVFWSAFQVIFGGVSENFDGTRRQVVGVKEVMHGLGVVVTGALLKIQGIAFAVKVALDYISPVLHFIGRVIRAVVDIVRGSIKGIGDAIDAVKPQFTIAITQISGAFTRLWNTIKPIWDRIKTTLAPVIERVVNAISPLVAKIRSFFGDSHTGAVTSTRRFNVFGETVRIVSSALIKAFTVVGTIFRVLAVVIDIGVYIFQRLAKEAGLAWIWIKKKADEFVKWVKPVLDDFRFFAEWVWKRISGNAEDYWRKANVIWNDIKHIAGVAWDFISSKAQAFYQFIRPLLDGIAYVAGIVWYFISSTAVAAWTAIKKAFSETAASIRGSSVYKWLQEKWGAIKSFIIGVWDSVSSKMHWLYGEIRSVVTSIGSGIRRVFEGVFNFIDHKIQWILQKFRGFRDSISEFLGPIARAVGLTPSPTTATNTSQIDETAVIGRAIMETSWDQSSTPAPSGSFRTPDRGIDIMDTSGDVKTEESPRAAQALKEVASTNAQLMNTLPNAIRQAVADGLSENNSRSMSPDR
jgi:phage-related protein